MQGLKAHVGLGWPCGQIGTEEKPQWEGAAETLSSRRSRDVLRLRGLPDHLGGGRRR